MVGFSYQKKMPPRLMSGGERVRGSAVDDAGVGSGFGAGEEGPVFPGGLEDFGHDAGQAAALAFGRIELLTDPIEFSLDLGFVFFVEFHANLFGKGRLTGVTVTGIG
jgi:hypothetical protein